MDSPPLSNVYVQVVTGNDPLKTLNVVKSLSELKSTSVMPCVNFEKPITTITIFYENSIARDVALATTAVFKKGIEAEVKSDSMKLGLVGVLDHNVSFKALAKKECVIYFNTLIDADTIKCTLDLLLNLLSDSIIGHHYGYEPPKAYESQLYWLTDALGFWRENILKALVLYKPKFLNLLYGNQKLNSATNIVGTHGNLILVTEVGQPPLTSIDVETDRGIFKLTLEKREFLSSSKSTVSSTVQMGVHRLFKTLPCCFYANGRVCYKGDNCQYAHGEHEIRQKLLNTPNSAVSVAASKSTIINDVDCLIMDKATSSMLDTTADMSFDTVDIIPAATSITNESAAISLPTAETQLSSAPLVLEPTAAMSVKVVEKICPTIPLTNSEQGMYTEYVEKRASATAIPAGATLPKGKGTVNNLVPSSVKPNAAGKKNVKPVATAVSPIGSKRAASVSPQVNIPSAGQLNGVITSPSTTRSASRPAKKTENPFQLLADSMDDI